MYGHNNTATKDLSYHFSGEFFEHSQVLDNVTVPVPALQVDCSMIPNNIELESVSATLTMKQQLCSGCSTSHASPSSAQQPWSCMMQNSLSSSTHLHDNNNNNNIINGFQYHQHLTHFSAYDDSTPRTKPFTHHMQGIKMVQQHHRSESPLSNESSIIECMNAKACKYSPQEKKEKIEKYKSKRNHRNFNKKIKYVCRKTLADSRPRIRGRFAKNNDENEKGGQLIDEWSHIAADNYGDLEEDDDNWISFVDAFSANVIP